MKRKLKAGATSQSIPVFVQDTSSSVGAGLGSLVYNSAGLAAKYRRQGDSSWTTITLATMTLGTWVSGGFVTDGGPVTGTYELGLPNAALASGATWVEVVIYGATNMLAVLIEIELDLIDYQDSVRAGLTALPNANAAASGGLWILGSNNTAAITIGNLNASTVTWSAFTVSNTMTFSGNVLVSGATTLTGAFTATNASNDVRGITVASIGNNVITANSIASDAITDAKVAADVTIAQVTGTVGGIAAGGITSTSFATSAITAAAIAADAIGASELAADAIAEIAAAIVTGGPITVASNGVLVTSIANNTITAASIAADAITAAKVASDVTTELQAGLATAAALSTLSTSVDDLPTNAELATALAGADDAVLVQVGLVRTVTDQLATALEADGPVYRFTANALEQAPSGGGGGGTTVVYVSPLVGVIARQTVRSSGVTEVFQHGPLPYGPIFARDANGDPVDLSGDTVHLVLESQTTDADDEAYGLVYLLTSAPGGKLTIGGGDSDEVTTAEATTDYTDLAGDWKWSLRVSTRNELVVAYGVYRIVPMAKEASP